jgi:hypothetical protein
LRIEHDAAERSRVFLGTRPGRAYAAHLIVPAVLMVTAIALTLAGLALGMALHGRAGGPAVDLLVAGPAVVGCAAMSARRGGRLPQEVLMTAMATDPSGGGAILLAWLLLWPAAAAALVALPLAGAGTGQTASTTWAVIELLAAAGLARAVARD